MDQQLPIIEGRLTRDQELQKVLSVFLSVPEEELEIDTFSSFHDFYEKTLAALSKGRPSEAEKLGSVNTSHICKIVEAAIHILASTSVCLRSLLREMLRGQPMFVSHSDDRLNRTIDLALRLWIPLPIRDYNYAPGGRTMQWDDQQSLDTFTNAQFPLPRTSSEASIRLDAMTMVKLKRFSGIEIEWTNDLSEHLNLSLVSGRRTVKVFAMKHYLNCLGKGFQKR